MVTSDERREVAERLRENAGKRGVVLDYLGSTQVASWWLLLHTIGCDSNEQEVAFRMLADLIDPTCRMTDSEWDNGERTWGCICSACDAHIEHTHSFSLDYCPHCGARVTERVMDLRRKTKP